MKRVLFVVAAVMAAGVLGQSLAASAADVLVPQQGVGAKYGARDPYTCRSKTEPKTGPISADMAAQYFICQWEKVNSFGSLFLTANVHVEVGKPAGKARRVLMLTKDADPDGLVYPIRGSFDNYLCSVVDNTYPPDRSGHNCAVWHYTHATGNCYRTGFGDWSCMMLGADAQQIGDQPPPGYRPAAAAAAPRPGSSARVAPPPGAVPPPPPANAAAAPSPSTADIEAGMRLFQKHDYRGAYLKFHAAVQRNLTDPLALLWEGLALDALGRSPGFDYTNGNDNQTFAIPAMELAALSDWHHADLNSAKAMLNLCVRYHPENGSCADMLKGVESGASAPPIAEWPGIVGLVKITMARGTVWRPARQ